MTGYDSKRQMAAYRDALFEKFEVAQPAQEPVAFICQSNLYMAEDVDEYCTATHIPLYTAPPQRPWVGLTDEEIDAIYWQHENHCGEYKVSIWPYERAIEAKLKEKNFD